MGRLWIADLSVLRMGLSVVAGTRVRAVGLLMATALLMGGCSSSPARGCSSSPAAVPSASDSPASTSPADAVQPIAAAREAGVGAEVTVEGTVTTPPGAFASSLSDDGYAIQDASGGIFVSRSAVADVRVGDEVRVSGTVAANSGSGLLVLIPDTEPLVVSTKGRTVSPEAGTTGTVAAKAEGTLVSTSGTIVAAPVQIRRTG